MRSCRARRRRAGHERRAEPEPGGGDADRLLRQERLVGGAERVAVGDVQLELADAVLEVRRLDPDAGALERRDDGVDEATVERGAQAVVRVRALVERAVGGHEVALELEGGLQLEVAAAQLAEHPAQRAARAERQRRAVRQQPVAEHPALVAEPRAGDGRRLVELQQHVGVAGVGARIPPVVSRGRRHPLAGDVESEDAVRESDPAACGGPGRNALPAPDTEMVSAAGVDVRDAERGDPVPDLHGATLVPPRSGASSARLRARLMCGV